MAEEETVTLALLWEHFSDEELCAMEGRIVGSLSPEEAAMSMQLMIPGMNRHERIRFLEFTRASAPPEAFEAIVNIFAKSALPAEDFRHLQQGLGLAA